MFAVVPPVNLLTKCQDTDQSMMIPVQKRKSKFSLSHTAQYFLEGQPMPSADGFILLGSKSPFPDTADTEQKDNFALNYLAMKVKLNRQVRIYWSQILESFVLKCFSDSAAKIPLGNEFSERLGVDQ